MSVSLKVKRVRFCARASPLLSWAACFGRRQQDEQQAHSARQEVGSAFLYYAWAVATCGYDWKDIGLHHVLQVAVCQSTGWRRCQLKSSEVPVPDGQSLRWPRLLQTNCPGSGCFGAASVHVGLCVLRAPVPCPQRPRLQAPVIQRRSDFAAKEDAGVDQGS